MTINKILFLIITILFVIGCKKEENIKEEEDDLPLLTINLITTDNPSFFIKTVILFENNDYLIKTNLDTYISDYPFNSRHGNYDEIKVQVLQDSNNKDILMMTDYLFQPNDSVYILAFHLEHGSCLIFNKITNNIIDSIEMEKYKVGDPIEYGGRRFYINGDLFLETVDMIS